jgi:hypothetical protein
MKRAGVAALKKSTGCRLGITYSLVGRFRYLQSAFAGGLQPSVPDSRF